MYAGFDPEKILVVFYGIAACSWMPHWACHYYRLETRSSFKVGSWNFSVAHSVASLIVYSLLVGMNLVSISLPQYRFTSALISGVGHLSIGTFHFYRVCVPFDFEIFGHKWSRAASLREVIIVIPFGLLCVVAATTIK